ncbi:MAG: hypothetical protein J6Y85_01310 [Alphaproteobacteria bacterium]|nr:hypothetical protein [Alphaproteobacteria bacterium]
MKKSFKIILCGALAVGATILGCIFACDGTETSPKTTTSASEIADLDPDPVPIVATMDINAERPFTAQIFWTEDPTDAFSEQRSVQTQVPEGQSRLELLIPTDIVHRFRFDFGYKPGKITISNIELSGIEPIKLNLKNFSFSPDVQRHEVNQSELTIFSESRDPYMIYKLPVDAMTD